MSLLTLVAAAAKELGLSEPSTAINSSDQQIIQLVALAQREGIELMKRHPWEKLTTERTFTGVAQEEQTGQIPADFDRFVDETFFNRSKKRPVFGPISPQDWQFTKSVVASTIIESFRVRGGEILLTPTPTTDTYAYEYISNKWCESSGGTAQTGWLADSDVGILSETTMTLGIIWRFLRAKGFDYAEAFRTYEVHVAQDFSRDGGKRRINMGSRSMDRARAPFVSEGSWNL
jgi:hypothetical protein